MIRVLLADDQSLVRSGFRMMLREPGGNLYGTQCTGRG